MTTPRLPILGGFIAVLGIALSVLVTPQAAHAGSAVGSTGTPGGCGGSCGSSPSTSNGYGWYRFDSSGAGPAQFKGGGNWESVSATCRAVETDTVIAFIILRPDGAVTSASVYNFDQTPFWNGSWMEVPYGGYPDYKGDDGGRWLSHGDAAARFSNLGSTPGFTFGRNVAWFCYNETPPWTLPPGTNPPPPTEPPGPPGTPNPNPNPNKAGVAAVADRLVAVPGDTITWTHSIRNNGPNPTHTNVTYHYQNRQGLGDTWGTDKILPKATAAGAGATFTSTYVVKASDLTKSLCRATSASPASSTNPGWIESSPACVSVPYNYALTPVATLASNRVIEGSATAKVDISVQNSGPTQSKPTQWRLTKIIVDQGGTVPNANGGNSLQGVLPCGTYFANAKATCSTVPGASGTSVFGVGGGVISGDQLPQQSVPIADLPIGTKICFALSVQPASSSTDQWRHSPPACITIGKKPKVQVLGSDLSVGKGFADVTGTVPLANIYTSTSLKDVSGVRTFGSWTEYGIFATGRIGASTGPSIASGSAYGGNPTGLQNATLCNTTTLSFTNAADATAGCTSSTVIGGYATTRTIPDVASTFTVTDTTPTLTTNDLANPAIKGVYKATADMTLSGGSIGPSRWVVLNAPTATVTITGNIAYTTALLKSASEIPQVIIIAKNIIIADGVTQLDAWLIAKGTINTCGVVGGTAFSETAALTASECKNQLVVNGPVMANKLFLRRTYGSGTGTTSGDPAEIFNLRPDAYMWAAARSQSGGRIQTVYSTELPPRL